jgi:ubiquinone/menaquinone biosynthesis C-methylase UbiE
VWRDRWQPAKIKSRIKVIFKSGLAQALPFPDGQFDAVLSTVMLHHLPGTARQECASEIRSLSRAAACLWLISDQQKEKVSSRTFTATVMSNCVI